MSSFFTFRDSEEAFFWIREACRCCFIIMWWSVTHIHPHNIKRTSFILTSAIMMKALLLFLSITVASSSNVRGAIDESIKHNLLTTPDASCLQLSYRTPDVCEHSKSSDGINKCVWCQTKHDGGVCLSPDNAKDAVEIMDVSCPNYSNNLLDERVHDERSTAVATPPDFNCFHSTWDKENAESSCKESRDKSNSPCVWCPMSGSEGGNAGACLSNNEAIMTNGKFGLTCPLNIYIEPAKKKVETDMPDLNCFGNAWKSQNAETACGESIDKNGQACVWCQYYGDKMGACLSRPEAGIANGQFGLKCPSAVSTS